MSTHGMLIRLDHELYFRAMRVFEHVHAHSAARDEAPTMSLADFIPILLEFACESYELEHCFEKIKCKGE